MTIAGQQRDQRAHGFCAWCGAPRSGLAPFCATCGRAHTHSDTAAAAGHPGNEDTVVFAADGPATAETQEQVWPLESFESPSTPVVDSMGQPSASSTETASRLRGAGAWLRSRWVVLTAAALVTLLGVWGVVAGVGYLRDRPVHTALNTATGAYRPVISQLTAADDFLTLQAAGQRAQRALPSLRRQHVELQGRSGELADVAVGVVGAQVAVAEAVEDLSELDEQSLAEWGELHTALAKAVQQETRARGALTSEDSQAEVGLPDTRGALAHAEQFVGGEVAGSASAATGELLDQLTDARRTSDVRDVASVAEATADTLAAAQTGVDGTSPDGRRLAAATDVLNRLAALSALDGDNLEVWSTVQAPLESTLAAWTQGESALATSAPDDTVEALDALVTRAEEKLAEWEASYNAAVEDRAEDLDALASYADSMRAELETYDGLRAETSDFVDRIDTVTYQEAYNELSEGAQDRFEVWDAMTALEVPGEVRSAHDGLAEIVDDAVNAMYAAYDGVYDSERCTTSCFYNMTPAWREFSSESDRITGEFEAATGTWEAAVAAAERSIETRGLPAKPQV